MSKPRFDVQALADALDEQRRANRLSWRQVAEVVGVGLSTLRLITNDGKRPDIDTFAALTRWLGMPATAFMPHAISDMTDTERLSVRKPAETVVIRYTSSSGRRVVGVDGMTGGVTPSGKLHLSVWSERNPDPPAREFHLTDGQIGEPLGGVDTHAIIREVAVDLVVSETVARLICDWMSEVLLDLAAERSDE